MHTAKAVYLALLFPGTVFVAYSIQRMTQLSYSTPLIGIVKLLTIWWARRQRSRSSVESEPLLNDGNEPQSSKKVAPIAIIDLWLARVAVSVDIVFYGLAFLTRSGALFAVYTSGISFGTHFGPTVQSIALDVYGRHGGTDTGRLLGALTVVSAMRCVFSRGWRADVHNDHDGVFATAPTLLGQRCSGSYT